MNHFKFDSNVKINPSKYTLICMQILLVYWIKKKEKKKKKKKTMVLSCYSLMIISRQQLMPTHLFSLAVCI